MSDKMVRWGDGATSLRLADVAARRARRRNGGTPDVSAHEGRCEVGAELAAAATDTATAAQATRGERRLDVCALCRGLGRVRYWPFDVIASCPDCGGLGAL
jgi:hypothetical protein